VQQLLLDGASADRIAGAGIGWVVAQLGSRGEMGDAAKTLATLPVVYRDGEIALHRVDGQAPGAPKSHRRAAVATHALWLAVLAVGTLGSAGTTIRSWPLTRRPQRSF
jgi:hypothetical protein